jgi:outer membrane protein insertion porin family
MRRLLRVPCILCVLCAGAQPAAADVRDYLNKPIGSVRLLIEGRETADPVLTSVVETAAGSNLSMTQVRETITHLFSLGRFEGVGVDATLVDGRVALSYELVPIHPVSRIRFAGATSAPGIDTGAMRRAIVDRYGVSPPLGRVADMSRILTDALRERGYLRAQISPRAEIEHDPERATLVFTIEPGARTTIRSVDIVGRPTVSRDEFLSRLGASAGSPYQRDALNARIERYLQDRRSQGYYEARVLPVVQLSEDQTSADLMLTVTPGPRVRVVFTGDPLPSDRRAELVPVEREGSVDEDLLEDSSNRIEEFLHAQGYRDAVAPHVREQKDEELVITFAISRGQQYRVSTFEVSGNASVPLADFEQALRVRSGDPFSDARLDADVRTIGDLYRRRGFAVASVKSGFDVITRTQPPAQVPVAVRIVVAEGPRITIDAVTFAGNRALDDAVLRAKTKLQAGEPYVPAQMAVDRDAIQLAYQDLGYESATVDARPAFSQNDTHATVTYQIQEGPQVFVDHVLIVGNVRTSTSTIERELQVKPGDPFSVTAITESQRRLTALGLFRRARISELPHGAESLRDLLVTIEEALPTSIGYGGGVEGKLRVVDNGPNAAPTEEVDFAPRAFFDIGRRNVFGKNRSINFFSSVSLHPQSSFFEYRTVFTFREPHVFNTPADALVNVTSEQQTRSSFDFSRHSVTIDFARKLTREVSVTGSYQLQRTSVFNELLSTEDQLLIDTRFPKVLLSSFLGSVIRDTRDDQIDPSNGGYLAANGQIAARAIGSKIGFVKSFFTAQGFHPIAGTSRFILAASARLGFAAGFPREAVDDNGDVIPGEVIRDLPQSERFYAGGDTTNRGFALDRVGVHHVPDPDNVNTLTDGLLPLGGNGLVVLNAELRTRLGTKFGVVSFLDTGNVYKLVSNIDLTEMRSSVGGGVRYKSPFGPLRFDIGFKVNKQVGEDPFAWFISFGQAF